ncbi:competence protein CoiA family protein [Kitasatospora sp. NPDC002965]|uniref:competence protein CoiA n=1 Tax=Kitasatospora sp. NPDC002965 TaxID=3154775 RepID=UPI0033B16D2B
MSFTALHPDAGRLDATAPDLGCGLPWTAIYKVRPRIPLTCPDCGHGVHARRSTRGLHHFAHDRRRPEHCELAEESMEHHLLKLELACAIRATGWHAELEVAAADGTWRADVMATAPDASTRIAWEAQLSPVTVDDITARTERYREADVKVCWVTTRREAAWLGQIPSIRTSTEHGWRVDDGVAGFDYDAGRWTVQPMPLQAFVTWVHNRSLAFHVTLPRYRRVHRPVDDDTARRPILWTTNRSITAEARHNRTRQRQEERKRAWQEQQAKLEAEQERLRQEAEAARKARAARHRRLRAEHQALQDDLYSLLRRGRWALEDRKREHEAEQRRLREEAEALRIEQQRAADRAAGQAWWSTLSAQQHADLDDAVTSAAWKEAATRADINTSELWPTYAYGKLARIHGTRFGRTGTAVFGIIWPCPALAARCPDLHGERIFVRNATEGPPPCGSGPRPSPDHRPRPPRLRTGHPLLTNTPVGALEPSGPTGSVQRPTAPMETLGAGARSPAAGPGAVLGVVTRPA